MSFITGTNTELIYASTATGTAKNTFTTEVQINDTTGMGVQAHLPADFWLPNNTSIGRGFHIVARGILSTTTSAPTFTWTLRLGASGSITTDIVLGSAAITPAVSQTNVFWDYEGDVILTAIGAAGTNSTVRGVGRIISSAFGAPYMYVLYGGAATPGTVATVDTSITNYINFNVACGTSNASNGVTLQQLLIFGLN